MLREFRLNSAVLSSGSRRRHHFSRAKTQEHAMRSGTDLLVVAEDDYAGGHIFRSGGDEQNQLTVRRTRFTTANPEVTLCWGNKPGYVARLFLAAANGSKIWQSGNRVVVPPRRTW